MSATTALARAPSGPPAGASAAAECFATIAHHSRSFALASRLLPREGRIAAAVVYTWCRRADDAVDLAADRGAAEAGLARLRAELADVYARPEAVAAGPDLALAAFGEVVHAHGVPARYPRDLLDGMAMDVAGHRYAALEDLLLYCYRAAGTVGLMMSHVMGVSAPAALRHASHLGIAMQLTNVCRDVAEDWARGRLYLPDDLLAGEGLPALRDRLGGPLPPEAAPGIARVIARLLALADRYYASGDRGLPALHWRSALAVRTARLVYARIGRELALRRFDPLSGRAVVPGWRKLLLVGRAGLAALAGWPRRLRRRFARAPLTEEPALDLLHL